MTNKRIIKVIPPELFHYERELQRWMFNRLGEYEKGLMGFCQEYRVGQKGMTPGWGSIDIWARDHRKNNVFIELKIQPVTSYEPLYQLNHYLEKWNKPKTRAVLAAPYFSPLVVIKARKEFPHIELWEIKLCEEE